MSSTTWTSRIPKISAEIRPQARRAVMLAAMDIKRAAKVNAPVDTGNLRSSVSRQMIGVLSAEITVGAEYGAYVEFGTTKMGAQPFLLPAVEQVTPAFRAAIRSLFR